MPRPRREPPASYSSDWPSEPCSDAAAEKVRLLIVRLRDAMGERSLRSTVAEIDMDYSVLSDYLNGRAWPDSRAIALLEIGLNASLWPPHEGTDATIHESPQGGVDKEARDTRTQA